MKFELVYMRYGMMESVPSTSLGGAILRAMDYYEYDYFPTEIKHNGEVILNQSHGLPSDWLRLYQNQLAAKYGEDAYDGSTNFPKRELTARERDILCRVIGDIWTHCAKMIGPAKEEGKLDFRVSYAKLKSVPIRWGEEDFFEALLGIRKAITPRNENWVSDE